MTTEEQKDSYINIIKHNLEKLYAKMNKTKDKKELQHLRWIEVQLLEDLDSYVNSKVWNKGKLYSEKLNKDIKSFDDFINDLKRSSIA